MTAEGSVYQRKDGRWVAQYRDAKGKTRYLYRKTKTEAKKALREALRDRDDNIVPPSRMTLCNLLDEWMDERRETISRRTWINQESIIRCHVQHSHIGSQMLTKLSGRDIQKLYRQKLSDGLAASTVRQMHVLLNQAMRDAVRSRYIRTNPLDGVKPPKDRKQEWDVLSPEDVRTLLDAAIGSRYEGIVVLGATVGLRVGEALALRCDDVDFAKGTITIRHTLWHGDLQQPKTPSSRRTIKVPQIALEALRRACKDKDGFIFATSNGTPLDASNFYKWIWRPLLRKAQLPESTTYHSLRHGAASLLLSHNVPIPVVSKYLGHSNPSITMKVYAHQLDDDYGLAGSAMDTVLGSF